MSDPKIQANLISTTGGWCIIYPPGCDIASPHRIATSTNAARPRDARMTQARVTTSRRNANWGGWISFLDRPGAISPNFLASSAMTHYRNTGLGRYPAKTRAYLPCGTAVATARFPSVKRVAILQGTRLLSLAATCGQTCLLWTAQTCQCGEHRYMCRLSAHPLSSSTSNYLNLHVLAFSTSTVRDLGYRTTEAVARLQPRCRLELQTASQALARQTSPSPKMALGPGVPSPQTPADHSKQI